jgi:general secretion pathway protein I
MERSSRPGRQRGFTLVEVLVALAILGLVAASIVALIGQNTRFIADQEEKMLAGMLVDTAMVEALAREAPMERGEQVAERDFAGRQWQVKTTVVEAGVANVIRIETSVSAVHGPQVLARATTLKSEGAKP